MSLDFFADNNILDYFPANRCRADWYLRSHVLEQQHSDIEAVDEEKPGMA